MEAIRSNLRFILIGLVILVLLCLIGVLAYQIFVSNGGDVTGVATATPVPAPLTTEAVAEASPGAEEVTPTPTRVILDETPTLEAPEEATVEPMTPAATNTPITPRFTATPSSAGATGATTTTPTARVIQRSQIEQLLKNGDFEEGFDEGLAENWGSFQNESMIASFSPESPGPYVRSGSSAQRITIAQASQGDRHAGIYQQVDVVAGQVYTLTLNGMIRSGQGDIQASSYGYRMQYAIDDRGGTNWANVPPENWIELPWDEQKLHTPDVRFSTYTATLTASTDNLTLFIRSWNKWPDPGEVQYTLDSLSLVGPLEVTEEVLTSGGGSAGSSGSDTTMIDQPLPTTGASSSAGLFSDGRFWGALVVLLLLAIGAVYRARWNW